MFIWSDLIRSDDLLPALSSSFRSNENINYMRWVKRKKYQSWIQIIATQIVARFSRSRQAPQLRRNGLRKMVLNLAMEAMLCLCWVVCTSYTLHFWLLDKRMAETLLLVMMYRYGGDSTYSLSSSVLNYHFEVRLLSTLNARSILISVRRMADGITPTTKENTLWYG